jgi:hypothetical protein
MERPVLFSGPLVRAILDGRKVQTRRPIKPQPGRLDPRAIGLDSGRMSDWIGERHDGSQWRARCPLGEIGKTRLYVREAWREEREMVEIPYPNGSLDVQPSRRVIYRASEPAGDRGPWRPGIHMKREDSRITLEVTDIRVQRLDEITDEDAIAEGVEGDGGHPVRGCLTYRGKRDAFFQVWEDIYGKTFPFASKPWVWAVSFKRVMP